jgi:hypothetical protein
MTRNLPDHHRLLLNALNNPASVVEYKIPDWELLLRLVRRVKLLGFLAAELERRDLLDKIPVRAANQLRSGLIRAKKLQQLAHWELNRIASALKDTPVPMIVLKGAAYALAKLPSAEGRYFVDLDIMVPKESLDQVEALLLKKGWRHRDISAYDERYYRAWSHEIPALIHRERETEIDIHHTIAPVTSRVKIDTCHLFDDAMTPSHTNYKILCPVDMVLHCAVNLFQNNELADDLRDLLDLHGSLAVFGNEDPGFWRKLIERANQLCLGKPLFYGIQFSRLVFQTPVPGNVENELNEKPSIFSRSIMHFLVPPALFPLHPDKPSKYARLARFLLYLRSHWIRMPLHLLLPHLAYKCYLMVVPGKTVAKELGK